MMTAAIRRGVWGNATTTILTILGVANVIPAA
jgi:hypothetical protein